MTELMLLARVATAARRTGLLADAASVMSSLHRDLKHQRVNLDRSSSSQSTLGWPTRTGFIPLLTGRQGRCELSHPSGRLLFDLFRQLTTERRVRPLGVVQPNNRTPILPS